jgi:mannonate dehydratase
LNQPEIQPFIFGCVKGGLVNVSPAGHAVNMHLDLASYNFGIQEQNVFSPTRQEVFPGCPEIKGGYM